MRIGRIIGFQIIVVGLRLVERCLCLLKRETEWDGIDFEQFVAGFDALAFFHQHFLDLAGNVRRDENLLCADIGVVGGRIAPAGQIECDAADQHDDREHHEQ